MILSLASCSFEVDDVFDKSSAERISETIDNDYALLQSAPNGWLVQYYADTQYGGHNMIWKFNNDSSVTAISDLYYTVATSVTSHFKLEQSQGVILSFDTYNPVIHFYSDPINPLEVGDAGEGMLGDFEFRILSSSSDSIVMKGKKHGSRIVMTPLKSEVTWKNYLSGLDSMYTKMYKANYLIIVGNDTVNAMHDIQSNLISYTDPTNGIQVEVPYCVTETGWKLYKEYTLLDQKFSGFTYSEDKKWVATDNPNIRIEPYTLPLSQQLISSTWYLSYSNAGSLGQATFDLVKKGMDFLEESITSISLGSIIYDNVSFYGVTFVSSGYYGTYGLNAEIIDNDHIAFTANGVDGKNATWYATYNYKYMAFSFGLGEDENYDLVPLKRTFKLTTDNVDDPSSIQLEEVNSTNNVIVLTKTEPKGKAFFDR